MGAAGNGIPIQLNRRGPTVERRTFLRRVTMALHAVAACIVGLPAFRFLFHPPLERPGSSDYIRVGPAPAGPSTDPVRAVVQRDGWDSFLHYPPGPVGAVWLVPGAKEGGPPTCLQTICPHLGCTIDYDAGRAVFYCPCHNSDFALNGQRLSGPSPRGMDPLTCRISAADADGRTWIEVHYQEFQIGRADQQIRS